MNPTLQTIISSLTSSGFVALVIFLITRWDKKKEAENAKDSAESRMLLGLGHDKIVYLTDKYVRRGAISLKEKRNLEFLYKPYAELGGNGDCKVGYDACQSLPVVSDDEAQHMDIEMKRRDYYLEDDERNV